VTAYRNFIARASNLGGINAMKQSIPQKRDVFFVKVF
jgi:hypothetical protein